MPSAGFDVDNIIDQLLSVRGMPGQKVYLTPNQIVGLCNKAKEIFLSQPMLLELEAPLKICGDIHGQFHDLLRLFDFGGYPPTVNYLFLGDYVDRGKQSVEVISLLLAFKIKYPGKFFMIRGNHEDAEANRIYGFFEECNRRYSTDIWRKFIDCFEYIPVAAIIENSIFCVHGGLSPSLTELDQIRALFRPVDVPIQGLVCDLLWSDPAPNLKGWGESERGIAFTFGDDVVENFLKTHNLDLICRAHQVVEDGYEFFANRKLVTVFSAPNYCGEFGNSAAIYCLDAQLKGRFQILKPLFRKPK